MKWQIPQIPRLWAMIGAIAIALNLLTGCTLPQVSAEDRLFRPWSVEFLGEDTLPKTSLEGAPVGGLSGITYDRQRDRFYAVSDDRANLGPARFYTLKLTIDPTPNVPHPQKFAIEQVTPLTDLQGQPYAAGTIDAEGIALTSSRSLMISSEGSVKEGVAPFVGEFDLQTGKLRRTLPIPEHYLPNSKDSASPRGIQENLAFEGLTLMAGGPGEPYRVFTMTESALMQDVDPSGSHLFSRMMHYVIDDRSILPVAEHAYPLDIGAISARSGVSEILAVDQGGHFIVVERASTLSGFTVKLFQVVVNGATDISTIASLKDNPGAIVPMRKRLLADLSDLNLTLDNLEGITLGPQLSDGSQSLILVSDDNFRNEQSTQFLIFRFSGV